MNLPAQFFWHSSVAARLPLILPGWQSSSHLAQVLSTVSQYCCRRSHRRVPHRTTYESGTSSGCCGSWPDSRMYRGWGIPTTAPTLRVNVRARMRLAAKKTWWTETTIITDIARAAEHVRSCCRLFANGRSTYRRHPRSFKCHSCWEFPVSKHSNQLKEKFV